MPQGTKRCQDWSKKDADFIEKWTETGFDVTKRELCAEAAGLGEGEIARMNGGRVTKALLQNQKLREACKRINIDMDKIAGKLAELLECKSAMNPEANDNYIQHKTVETLIKVFDANPPQKIEVDRNTTTQVVISEDTMDRLEKYHKMRSLELDEASGYYTERPKE